MIELVASNEIRHRRTADDFPFQIREIEDGYCGANNREGGGTGWLVTQGNVQGGETITLRIALWDTSDGFYDSTAIIDKFEWSVDAAEPGTVIP